MCIGDLVGYYSLRVREYECALHRRTPVAAGESFDSSGSVLALVNTLGGNSVETGVDS